MNIKQLNTAINNSLETTFLLQLEFTRDPKVTRMYFGMVPFFAEDSRPAQKRFEFRHLLTRHQDCYFKAIHRITHNLVKTSEDSHESDSSPNCWKLVEYKFTPVETKHEHQTVEPEHQPA